MSADLNTFIELEGTLEELRTMVTVIKGYCNHNKDVTLDFARISHKKRLTKKMAIF